MTMRVVVAVDQEIVHTGLSIFEAQPGIGFAGMFERPQWSGGTNEEASNEGRGRTVSLVLPGPG